MNPIEDDDAGPVEPEPLARLLRVAAAGGDTLPLVIQHAPGGTAEPMWLACDDPWVLLRALDDAGDGPGHARAMIAIAYAALRTPLAAESRKRGLEMLGRAEGYLRGECDLPTLWGAYERARAVGGAAAARVALYAASYAAAPVVPNVPSGERVRRVRDCLERARSHAPEREPLEDAALARLVRAHASCPPLAALVRRRS